METCGVLKLLKFADGGRGEIESYCGFKHLQFTWSQ